MLGACLALAVLGSGSLAAQQTPELLALHTKANDGDAEALAQLRAVAEKGNAEAESRLGDVYSRKGDTENALKWTRRGVEHGNPDAQNMLGFWYERGRGGVQQDKAQARKLYLAAARQGHATAELNLCIIDDFAIPRASAGKAVSIEPIKATKDVITETTQRCHKAADQGSLEAQWRLGVIYAKGGGGIPPNYEEAYFWLTVRQGSTAFRLRDKVAEHLTAQVRDALDKRAVAWRPAGNALAPSRTNIILPNPRR
jgi:TPR repeat protein